MRKLRQVLFATAVAMSSVVFASDTWYWQSITKCTGLYEYGYSLTSADNWVNAATGLNGIPVSGDIVIIGDTVVVGHGLGGFGAGFDADLAQLEDITVGGGADTGFADELAELDLPTDNG